MNRISFIICVTAALLATVSPQFSNVSFACQVQVKPKKRSRSGKEKEMARLVSHVVKPLLPSIALLKSGRRNSGMGLVISEDGMVLTKRGNLRPGMNIEVDGTVYKTVKTIGVLKEADLAVVKIDAVGLQAVEISDITPSKGEWLISPTQISPARGRPSALAGVLSESTHKQKPHKGFLGIRMLDGMTNNGSPAVKVVSIVANSAADKSDIQVGDLITAVNGESIASRKELAREFSKISAGDWTSILLEREGLDVMKSVVLGKNPAEPNGQRFAMAFGHDTKLMQNRYCGGPVVNLQGQVVGINVSGTQLVAGTPIQRTQSTADSLAQPRSSNLCKAIPGKYINLHLKALTSGQLAPATENRELLEFNAVQTKLKETELAALTERTKQFEIDRLKQDFQKLSEKERFDLTSKNEFDQREERILKHGIKRLAFERKMLKLGMEY